MKEELIKLLSGDVDISKETLTSHAHDASLFEVEPEVVVYPKDTQDVQKLVAYVAEKKEVDKDISITARSAGTCMAGGPLNTSIILDGTRYLNAIRSIKKTSTYPITPHFPGAKEVQISGQAEIGPGVYYRDFEKEADKYNLLLPCFTASKSINALGGMIGNNSGGELSLKYGKTEDYVKSVEVVLADGSVEVFEKIPRQEAEHRATQNTFAGNIYKEMLALLDEHKEFIASKKPQVTKNSAGYNLWNIMSTDETTGTEMIDFTQLIVGSQGTLGITTGATLHLVEQKKESALLVVFLSKLDRLAVIDLLARSINPETIEAYDDKTITLAIKFWRGFIKKRGFWGALKLGFQFLPEVKMLFSGMPKLVLLVECAGKDKEEILARLQNLQTKLKEFPEAHTRLVKRREKAEKYWTIRHDSFALLREHFQGKRTAPFIDDVIVPIDKLPEFVPAIRNILEKHNLTYNIHGHAGNGNFHIIPLINTDARLSEEMILQVSEEVYSLTLRLGGSITAEHNDGIIRTPFLKDMYGEKMIELFEKTKKIFDPKNIFNPGKKVGLEKGNIGKYLAKGK